ncbi:Gfo/Idh/MocA family protein [Halobellus rubicundus]|uniref:Gfo/Idh/MocA family protein n=1 Tax=Halobellus rubicundus TaxID=2996466 RepID=A0ABD5MD21_9EURY
MTLSIGMLGYRFMGKAHSNAFSRLSMFFPDAPDIERDVLVGRDEDALADAADRLGFARTATDWREVVDEVDVFYNLGPNDVHVEPSVAALEAGVPVLSEKPLAATLDGAERMAEAAAEADVPTAVAFNYRYVPAIQHAKQLIDEGAIGEIHHVRANYLQDWLVDPQAPWSWRNSEEIAGSGALGDLGAHSIDLAQYLLGDSIERVSGHLKTFVEERPVPGADGGGLDAESGDSVETRPVTVDDAYSAQAEFANGAMGTFEASRFANGQKNAHTIAINGSDGSLRFDLERLNELEVLRDDGRGFETVLVTDPDDPYLDHWWPPGHVLGWEHTFVHEDYEFLSAVAEGESYGPNFADGLAVQRVLDAIERSDESGRWVEV